jgi:hypothetical protein
MKEDNPATEETPERLVPRPSNVLISSPDDGSLELPNVEGSAESTAFVVVSLLGGLDEPMSVLEEVNGGPADSVHIIGVEGPAPDGDYDSLRTVSQPGDLTGLSMRIGAALSDLSDEDVTLYFDDVTCLLQYTDLNTAYRFFNVFTGRVRQSDGVGLFGISPGAHDERETSTLRNLFDDSFGEFS